MLLDLWMGLLAAAGLALYDLSIAFLVLIGLSTSPCGRGGTVVLAPGIVGTNCLPLVTQALGTAGLPLAKQALRHC